MLILSNYSHSLICTLFSCGWLNKSHYVIFICWLNTSAVTSSTNVHKHECSACLFEQLGIRTLKILFWVYLNLETMISPIFASKWAQKGVAAHLHQMYLKFKWLLTWTWLFVCLFPVVQVQLTHSGLCISLLYKRHYSLQVLTSSFL